MHSPLLDTATMGVVEGVLQVVLALRREWCTMAMCKINYFMRLRACGVWEIRSSLKSQLAFIEVTIYITESNLVEKHIILDHWLRADLKE